MPHRAEWRQLPTDPRTRLGWMKNMAWELLTVPDLEASLPVPCPLDHVLIQFEVGRGSFVRGADYGMATFVDGWLHVEGRRTAFALAIDDVRQFSHLDNRRYRLTLQDGSFVSLLPSLHDPMAADRFLRSFSKWTSAPAPQVGESMLPPQEALPSVYAIAHLWIAAGLGLGFLTLPLSVISPVLGTLSFVACIFMILWGWIESSSLRMGHRS